jgi:hypothetical protein
MLVAASGPTWVRPTEYDRFGFKEAAPMSAAEQEGAKRLYEEAARQRTAIGQS